MEVALPTTLAPNAPFPTHPPLPVATASAKLARTLVTVRLTVGRRLLVGMGSLMLGKLVLIVLWMWGPAVGDHVAGVLGQRSVLPPALGAAMNHIVARAWAAVLVHLLGVAGRLARWSTMAFASTTENQPAFAALILAILPFQPVLVAPDYKKLPMEPAYALAQIFTLELQDSSPLLLLMPA